MPSSSTTQPMIDLLARRGLVLPALLFLTALQPLYCIAGHVLLVAAPLAALLGVEAVGTWGARLNDPNAIAAWRQHLTQAADEP